MAGTALAILAVLFTSHFRGKRDLCFMHVNKAKPSAATSMLRNRLHPSLMLPLAYGKAEPLFSTTAAPRSEPVASFPVRTRSY